LSLFGAWMLKLSVHQKAPLKSLKKFEKKDLVVFLSKREHLEKVESLFRISSLV